MKNVRKICKSITVVAMVIAILVATSSEYAFALENAFTWHQSISSKVVSLGYMAPGSNINTSGVKFFAVATSPAEGSFDVILQRKGWFGWENISTKRIGYQSSTLHYDPINYSNVYGSPFLCVWSVTGSGEYRVVLENPTNPQETVFTRVSAWAY